MSRRRPGLALLVLLHGPAAAATDGISCHIHPPGSTPQRPVGTIGPFDAIEACERERLRRFGPAGRCHCTADFSPRWLAPPDSDLPGQSPLSRGGGGTVPSAAPATHARGSV